MSFDLILVTWNRPEYLRRTVGSLVQSGAFDACERLIVVDNHSTHEGSLEFLNHLTLMKKTFVLHRPQNDGWAAAVNDGLMLSRAPFVFLVNNDVEFEPGFHETMLNAHDINVGILAGWRHTAHSVTVPHERYDEMTDVPAVCWLLSKTALETAGLLEERGPCLTKGGNGEDSAYVQRMESFGLRTAAMRHDVCKHITGY